MAKKEYAHLIKPVIVKDPPPGLYPEPRIWLEGRDLEGFGAQFSYGFIKKPSVFHPLEGQLVHPYDECLVFEGTDLSNILHLGAEISVEIGEEREEHVFTEPTVVLVPRGIPHGPVRVRKLERTIVHYSIGLAPDYQAQALTAAVPSATPGTKYRRLIKKMITALPPEDATPAEGRLSSVIGRNDGQVPWHRPQTNRYQAGRGRQPLAHHYAETRPDGRPL